MRVYSVAFHTSYQYSLATAFPEIHWHFVNGVWYGNRPKPPNAHLEIDRPLERYDLYLAHDPTAYSRLCATLAGHGIPARRVIYCAHWAYNPAAWVHQAEGRSLEQFRREVAQSAIACVSHFLVQDFGFYSHVACEGIPHYVPQFLFDDVAWRGDDRHYINIVNDFFDPLRGAGSTFWRQLADVPKLLYGSRNGPEGECALNTLTEFKAAITKARAYLWTGERVAMSYAPLEAAAGGCPIIAPANMDWEKIFTDGHDALFYEPGNAASLKQVLARYEASPDLRASLSVNGRETIKTRFSLAQFRARWERVINGAMADW